MLTSEQIHQFIKDGYVKIEEAFSRQTAEKACKILWVDTGLDPDDPGTWTKPVIRLGEYTQPPFIEAANTPRLIQAIDQLVGKGRWHPRRSLGSFPVRFPVNDDPGDTGWHVDASFSGPDPEDYLNYRINVFSKGRSLLMLFLFSDVTEADAPTIIRRGSHQYVAQILGPYGNDGLSFYELADRLDHTSHYPEVLACGDAGTVFLCHPFLVHRAQNHRGKNPRFMAQPALLPADALPFVRESPPLSPMEQAILTAIEDDMADGSYRKNS